MILPFETKDMRFRVNSAESWPWRATIGKGLAMLEVFMNNKELATALQGWATEANPQPVSKITVEFEDGTTINIERNTRGS
jgi:hypothetical protein